MVKRIGYWLAGIACVIATQSALAQTEAASGGQWQYEISPYVFASGLNGTLGVGGTSADVDASFSDLTDYIDTAFMLVFEARKGQWGVAFDGIYTKLEDQQTRTWQCPICTGPTTGELKVTTTQQVYTVMALYRLQDTKTKLDAVGGARYTRIDNDVDLSLTPAVLPGGALSIGGFEEWWDPIIGIRVLHPLSENWSFIGYADYGGFGVGSDATYQALVGVSWHFAKDFTAKFGYRYLYQDYEDNGVIWDMALYGVIAGLGIRF